VAGESRGQIALYLSEMLLPESSGFVEKGAGFEIRNTVGSHWAFFFFWFLYFDNFC
jgi:hypothetical protein